MIRFMLRSITALGLFLIMIAAFVTDAFTADLTSTIESRPDGTVQIQFRARRGVYGDGDNVLVGREPHQWTVDGTCCDTYQNGPVFVELRVRRRQVVDIDVRVGGEPGHGRAG
jgi:hypothetical protein